MLVALLLIAAPGPFDAVFDPASDDSLGVRKAAFDSVVKKRGVGAAIRSFRHLEKLVAEAQATVDAVYAKYERAADAYWSYRKKTGAAARAVPAKLNKPALDLELAWKAAANKKRRLRTIQNWARKRVVDFLKPPVSKQVMGALLAGLKHRNPHQRWRCARWLGRVANGRNALAARGRVESSPGVLAAIFEALGGGAGIHHSAWQARAGAFRSLKDAALKKTRLKVEKGRLREDLGEAPGPTECFGMRSSSRRIVFCLDYPRGFGPHVIKALGTLPADALFSIVVCGGKVHTFKKKLVSGSRDAAIAWLKKIKTDGRSDLCAGLRTALDMRPDTVFLLTAAGPGGTGFWTQVMYPNPIQVGIEIMAYNRLKGVRIHAAGPSGGRMGYWLENLTKQFGGAFKGR